MSHGIYQHPQLGSSAYSFKGLNVFKKYVEGNVRLKCRLLQKYSIRGFELEPEELRLTAEKVTVHQFPCDEFAQYIAGINSES